MDTDNYDICAVAPQRSLKALGKSVQCLAKLGDEVFLSFDRNLLAFRGFNSSKSAYGCFRFKSDFFEKYVVGQSGFRCQLYAKSCLPVFKAMYSATKEVEKCTIYVLENSCRVVFQLHCKHGVMKTFNLTYDDCESLQAVFDKQKCPNVIFANPKRFSQSCLNFFGAEVNEICFVVSDSSFKAETPEDKIETLGLKQNLKSEVALRPSHFDQFSIQRPTEMTFCSSEFKAILSFCETMRRNICLYFDIGGRPLVVTDSESGHCSAEFVLSTIPNGDEELSESLTPNQINAPLRSTALGQNQCERPNGIQHSTPAFENSHAEPMSSKNTPFGNSGTLHDLPGTVGAAKPEIGEFTQIPPSLGDDVNSVPASISGHNPSELENAFIANSPHSNADDESFVPDTPPPKRLKENISPGVNRSNKELNSNLKENGEDDYSSDEEIPASCPPQSETELASAKVFEVMRLLKNICKTHAFAKEYL
eukprot:Nk52_evm33s295 gene=Nk52_evmTU33s295